MPVSVALNVMIRRLLTASVLLLATAQAVADGVRLKNGRYEGAVVIFDLTKEQKKVIDHYRNCQVKRFETMNQYTPYVFSLTADQAQALRAKKGFAPRYFQVYETYRGYNDAGPHWNLALRFKESQIEVPVDMVVTEKEARKAHAVQGWKLKNPCFPTVRK